MGRPDASPGVIVGFDHHSDEFNLNEREVNADLRSRCPVAWNEKYGGFWYVSSYDAVEQVPRDGDTFAHKYEPNAADGVNYQGEMGVPRPEGQPPLGIGEVDGPYHLALRRALTPFFSSGAIEKMRPFMRVQCQRGSHSRFTSRTGVGYFPHLLRGTSMSELLGIEQLAELLGTSANSVRNWRTIGYGPKSARIGRWVVYRRAEVATRFHRVQHPRYP